MNLENIIFSKHSILQFLFRYKNEFGVTLKKPEKTAGKLLTKAVIDEDMEQKYRLKRLLNNRIVPADYFVSSGWRFVIIKEDDKSKVVTIERVK